MNDEWQLDLHKILQYVAKIHGDTEIVSNHVLQGCGTFRYSYAQALDRIYSLASGLRNAGVKPGDRIAILDWNDHRYFESFYAISSLGAIIVNLNLRLHPDEVTYILEHSRSKVLLLDESLIDIALKFVSHHHFDFSILMSDKSKDEVSSRSGSIDSLNLKYGYEELIKENHDHSKKFDFEEIDERSSATACFTSGTTGKPKGVFNSHRSLVLHGWSLQQGMSMRSEDTFLQVTPMFHANGWGVHVAAAMTGCKLVFPGKYTPESLVQIMLEERPTLSCGVPLIWGSILDVVKKSSPKPNFNGLRIISGGSEPPLSLLKGWSDYGATIYQIYGATETTPVVTINHPKSQLRSLDEGEKWDYKRKQGTPVFGVEIKLVDTSTREDVDWDGKSIGEIWVKGPWILGEYYEDPRTKEQCTEDKWWKTGDIGVMDQFGYLKLVDRAKDLIKSGGEWISSVDMENYLMGHPSVLEAAVVGIQHPKWEERPLALVVLRPEHKSRQEDELRKELKEHLLQKFTKWQLPDQILFVQEIPRTSVGKIAKGVIRERHKNEYLQTATEI